MFEYVEYLHTRMLIINYSEQHDTSTTQLSPAGTIHCASSASPPRTFSLLLAAEADDERVGQRVGGDGPARRAPRRLGRQFHVGLVDAGSLHAVGERSERGYHAPARLAVLADVGLASPLGHAEQQQLGTQAARLVSAHVAPHAARARLVVDGDDAADRARRR